MRSADIDRCDSEFRPDGPVANGGGDPAPGADAPAEPSDGLADEVTRLQQERDEYLDLARRARAEFENYRKRMMAQQAEQRDSAAAEVLASVVVPALDVLEAGLAHHPDAVEPIYRAVRQLAEGQGLERLDPAAATASVRLRATARARLVASVRTQLTSAARTRLAAMVRRS